MKMKRILAYALSAALVVSAYAAVPASVYADETDQETTEEETTEEETTSGPSFSVSVDGEEDNTVSVMKNISTSISLIGTAEDTSTEVSVSIDSYEVTSGSDILSDVTLEDSELSFTGSDSGSATIALYYTLPEGYEDYQDANDGCLTVTVNILNVTGTLWITSDAEHDYVLNGQSVSLEASVLLFGDYQNLDLDYAWTMTADEYSECLDLTVDTDDAQTCTASLHDLPANATASYEITCTLSDQGIQIAQASITLEGSTEFYELSLNGFNDSMSEGDTCVVTPVVTGYTSENPDGFVVDADLYTVTCDSTTNCTVTENGDGTWTVSCESAITCSFTLSVVYENENGSFSMSDTWTSSTVSDSRELYYTRISGDDRIATAVAVAQQLYTSQYKYYSGGFDAVLIANGWNFPDALSGAPLASQLGAPILLVSSTNETLNQTTYDCVDSLATSNAVIYILGGTSAVPKSVENHFTAEGHQVFRLAGQTRYDTNVAIMNTMLLSSSVAVCCGTNYADALSMSGVAGMNSMPIVLASSKGLTSAQITAIENIDPDNIYIIGGTYAVNEATEAQITENFPDAAISRIAGATRYDTAVEIAKAFELDQTSSNAVVAYGKNFPDGLTGGVLAAALQAPMLLTDGSDTSVSIDNAFLSDSIVTNFYVIGGELVVTKGTARKFATTIMTRLGLSQ